MAESRPVEQRNAYGAQITAKDGYKELLMFVSCGQRAAKTRRHLMVTGTTALSDRLLTDLERQQKYLDKLPKDFPYPLFNAKQALLSQRQSGYRDTAAASREIVDNAIEAGANRIHVVFDTERSEKSNRRLVNAIAFIDNGSGMLPKMARYALSWGGGTHFDDSNFIGKFGFGLPNASINQTKQTEVYTRTDSSLPFTKVRLDLDDFPLFGQQSIPEEQEATQLPGFVQRYLDKNGFAFDHGTIVVWNDPDRLTYKKPANLADHLIDDFAVTYRYLLGDSAQEPEILVQEKRVQPVDPLFLMTKGRFYLPEDQGGAILVEDRWLPVKYYADPETRERRLELLHDESELNSGDPNTLAAAAIHIRIARFPIGFAEPKRGGDKKAEEKQRWEIRKSRRGVTFVRAKREIQTFDAFPHSARDLGNGLGQWPELRWYAYFWGVEVTFSPELDEVFGITNDKQGVRPIEDFWRVLKEAEIDDQLRYENNWQAVERRRKHEEESKALVDQKAQTDTPTPAEASARDADVAVGRPVLRVPEHRLAEAKWNLEQETQRLAQNTRRTPDEVRAALAAEAKRRPYRIEYIDREDGPFYEPHWTGEQIIVRINRAHPFFRLLYGDLLQVNDGYRLKEAVDLLLITLSKAEATAEGDDMPEWYEAQRKYRWSPYLETALKSLERRLQQPDEPSE